MPDQEVLINDSNLNAIANAIRRKNGLVRTYKPREMAPAIRAINAGAPDSREYTVTVIQTPHQTIKVRQVLGGEKQYDQSFTVSEPYWKIQATVEADAGYVAGGLNYPNEVTVDRDITIKATPATPVESPPDIINYRYIGEGNGSYNTTKIYLDEDLTQRETTGGYEDYQYNNKPQGRVIYNFIDKYSEKYGQGCYQRIGVFYANIGTFDYTQHAPDATDIIQNLNLLQTTHIERWVWNNGIKWLENIDLSSLNLSTVETIDRLINESTYLKSFGDISHWNTASLISVNQLIGSSRYIDSLDLSGWNTPNLQTATNVFFGSNARILDISNWDTTNISNFSAGISAKTKVGVLYPAYLIMDKEEIKFSGNYIFNNIANCKYLVPEDMVDAYKQHPNWASRASQIESITNYTINRGDGQIEVVPNW